MSIISSLSMDQCIRLYLDVMRDDAREQMRFLGRKDLFFLLTQLCKRTDMIKPWVFERVREVEAEPNGYLDLWAREHYKSTIITYGLTIQDILNDPEVTIGFFSINSDISKTFLFQVRQELQKNILLKGLYPDVLYADPENEAPRWSIDRGFIVRRKENPKEATVEAYGFIEGLPTSRHFKIRVYDDVINEKHVKNPDIVKKSISLWESSLNLGSASPVKHYDEVNIERYVGTRYGLNDTYAEIMNRGAAKKRIYPGTHDGTEDGEPVMWTKEFMAEKRTKMGSYTFCCQILQDPTADRVQGFKGDWLQFYTPRSTKNLNLYLLCDPAGGKKKDNDYTVMLVIGLGPDRNYYLIDGVRDRLNLTERTRQYIAFHRKYSPLKAGYEKYGKDSDIEHIRYVMDEENYRFSIVALAGSLPKPDRIRKLVPVFENGRFYLAQEIFFVDSEKRLQNLTTAFINEEYHAFPVAAHDDILDCMARILDPELGAVFPEITTDDYRIEETRRQRDNRYDPLSFYDRIHGAAEPVPEQSGYSAFGFYDGGH